MGRKKKSVSTDEALNIVTNDPQAMSLLVKQLLGQKCIEIGIQYPGSILELLTRMTPNGKDNEKTNN